MSKTALDNVKVVSTPIVIPAVTVNGVCNVAIERRILFQVTDGSYTYPIIAWADFADKLQEKGLAIGSVISIDCALSCWRQRVKHPNTGKFLLNSKGKEIQVDQFMLTVIAIKGDEVTN